MDTATCRWSNRWLLHSRDLSWHLPSLSRTLLCTGRLRKAPMFSTAKHRGITVSDTKTILDQICSAWVRGSPANPKEVPRLCALRGAFSQVTRTTLMIFATTSGAPLATRLSPTPGLSLREETRTTTRLLPGVPNLPNTTLTSSCH